jgi:hypothetical protein
MKTLKEIFLDLHNHDANQAHEFFSFLMGKYGRNSEEVRSLYDDPVHNVKGQSGSDNDH